MSGEREYLDYVQDMLDSAENALEFVAGMGYDQQRRVPLLAFRGDQAGLDRTHPQQLTTYRGHMFAGRGAVGLVGLKARTRLNIKVIGIDGLFPIFEQIEHGDGRIVGHAGQERL